MASKAVSGHKVDFSASTAAIAETYTTSDATLYTVQYFDVLSQDHVGRRASLWSVGTTNIDNGGWTGHGRTRGPTELLARDTAYGVDNGTYRSALGANIFITSTGQVGYDMSAMSAATRQRIDDLAIGQSVTDSFYYAIRLGSGGLSWNQVTVAIAGAAAQITAAPGHVVENQNVDASGDLTDIEALSVKAASGDATSFTIAPASGATIGTVTPNDATLNPDGSSTFASGSGTFTYTVSNSAVLATHLGYGESQIERFTITTANGTTASLSETVDGNINAPVVTAAAAQTLIGQDSSVQLNIAATDNDDNATLSYVITGVPAGATLSSATDPGGVTFDGAQSWAVAPPALGDITLTPGATFGGDIHLSVTVTNTEVNPTNPGDMATAATTATIDITVDPPPASPSQTLLDVPGAYDTFVAGINAAGAVAGYYQDQTGQHGFVYNGGTYTALDPVPGAFATQATAINGSGEVAGFYGDSSGFHGFLYDGSSYQLLNASTSQSFNAYYTAATALNDSGEVGGFYYDSVGEHGFLYDSSSRTYTTLDGPTGASQTYVNAVNSGGEAAGYYYDSIGVAHGFVYDSGAYTPLDPAGSDYTIATGDNDTGQVVGYYQDSAGTHGFLYDGASKAYTTIAGPAGATASFANAINNSGEIAGFSYDSAGAVHGFVYNNGAYTPVDGPSDAYYVDVTAINDGGTIVANVDTPSEISFVYNDGAGTYTELTAPSGTQAAYATAINDTGSIAGDYGDAIGQHGFVYDRGSGTYATLDGSPGAYDTSVMAINNGGQVIGNYDDSTGSYSFVYSGGNFTILAPASGATAVSAAAINNAGQVAGSYRDSTGTHGFVYNSGTSTYTTLSGPAGASSTFATGINDTGTIVGYYKDSSGRHGFTYQNGNYASLDASPTASWTEVTAVNSAGAVLGSYGDSNGQHIFVDQNGVVTTLSGLPATYGTVAAGFDNNGDVVGTYFDNAGQHGFLYHGGTGVYTSLDAPSAALGTTVYAINNLGDVVGGASPVFQHGLLAVPS